MVSEAKGEKILQTTESHRTCWDKNLFHWKTNKQKKVLVAYRNGDNDGKLKGTAPTMSTKLFQKAAQSFCVIVVNGLRTSKVCSCCHSGMTQYKKQLRMKRLKKSDCTRNVWDRSVNTSINILNLFPGNCYLAYNDSKGSKIKAFTR